HAEEGGPSRVQARRPPVHRRRLRGLDHRAPGIRDPLLDGRRQLPHHPRGGPRRRGRWRAGPRRAVLTDPRMAHGIAIALIDGVKDMVADLCTGWARALPDLVHVDVRLEVTEGKVASVENGEPKFANDDYGCAFAVRVLAGRRMIGAGYLGRTLGVADLPHLRAILEDALERAHRRATASGEAKADAREKIPGLGASLADTRLAPVRVARDVVPAVYRLDPRTLSLADMLRMTTDIGREIRALDARLTYSHLATLTELSRELFCSSEGALIDQTFALTQGMAYVVGS